MLLDAAGQQPIEHRHHSSPPTWTVPSRFNCGSKQSTATKAMLVQGRGSTQYVWQARRNLDRCVILRTPPTVTCRIPLATQTCFIRTCDVPNFGEKKLLWCGRTSWDQTARQIFYYEGHAQSALCCFRDPGRHWKYPDLYVLSFIVPRIREAAGTLIPASTPAILSATQIFAKYVDTSISERRFRRSVREKNYDFARLVARTWGPTSHDRRCAV